MDDDKDAQIDQTWIELLDKPQKIIFAIFLILVLTILFLSIGLYYMQDQSEDLQMKEILRDNQMCEKYSTKNCSSKVIYENKAIMCYCQDTGYFQMNLIGEKILTTGDTF